MARRSLSSISKWKEEWMVKQVTRSNFASLLPQLMTRISESDFVSISLQKTGTSHSSSSSQYWRRILELDNAETAYCKVRDAADTFELLQFAVCPFRLIEGGKKVVAFPYNFHLFPRDELNLGISYLSRVQESDIRQRFGHQILSASPLTSCSKSVADSVFLERIKSRLVHWRSSLKKGSNIPHDAVIASLRKLVVGGEIYGSRPCISLDVSSDRQVLLILEVLNEKFEDLVPLVVPRSDGTPIIVKLIFASSDEDKISLKEELQKYEDEKKNKIRGFRVVIDALSNSHKPIIAYGCLNDMAFIHSKFISPLPPTMAEFLCSLSMIFPYVVDVNHLMKEMRSSRKANKIHDALSYPNRQFFMPLDMEIPQPDEGNEYSKTLGQNVLRIAHIFAKLHSLKEVSNTESSLTNELLMAGIEKYCNVFYPMHAHEVGYRRFSLLVEGADQPGTENLVFLWGFHQVSSPLLKGLLAAAHDAFAQGFNLRLVDDSCVVVTFRQPGSAERFMNDIDSGCINSELLCEMVFEGLKAARFRDYMLVCKMGLWETNLAQSLERAMFGPKPRN